MSHVVTRVEPTAADVAAVERARDQVKQALAAAEAGAETVTIPVGSQAITLPRSLMHLLGNLLDSMSSGDTITILSSRRELTTQQAADILHVSRPHLVKLLDQGEIEFRIVGTHRRISTPSLMQYIHDDDRRRRGVAAELTSLGQELNLT